MAWSADVVIVLSGEHEPYRQAQQSLEISLKKSGLSSGAFLLDAFDHKAFVGTATKGVITIGTPASVWLHKNPTTAKMVYCMVSDPSTAGFTVPPSFSGISTDVPVTAQLQLVRDALPNALVIGTLYQTSNPRSVATITELRSLLPAGFRVEAVDIDAFTAPALAIDALLEKSIDVVWTAPDPVIYNNATVRSLLLTTLRRRIPVFGFSAPFVRAGALIGIGIDPKAQGRQAALHMQALLNGTNSSELIIIPTFDICLNLVVAQKLSVTLPPSLIERANQLFQPGR